MRGERDLWCNSAEKSSDVGAADVDDIIIISCSVISWSEKRRSSSPPAVHRDTASYSQWTSRNMEINHTGSSRAECRAGFIPPPAPPLREAEEMCD